MALPLKSPQPAKPAPAAAAAPAAGQPRPAPAPAKITVAPGLTVPAAPGPTKIRLKKGETLFNEGENSRAMYYLKSGMIRIFKKKGDSDIEIDTIRTGAILGELAFLDGLPRSASGEALTECDLVEISSDTFAATLAKMPEWLKILLKTVVGRLRTASTRIRQLESASTQFDYSDKDGKRKARYVYLSTGDVLKILTGVLLVGARNGTETETGIHMRVGLLQRYCNQIMGVPVAKITTLLDVLSQVGIVTMADDAATEVTLNSIEFLEELIAYINEENLVEPKKRHDLSNKGFLIMSLMAKHMNDFEMDKETGTTNVNFGQIKRLEAERTGKDPFRADEMEEMVKLGYCSNLTIKSSDDMFTAVKTDAFMRAFRFQRVVKSIEAINVEKGGKKG